MSIREFLPGDTAKVLWTNSGVTPDALVATLLTGSESLVFSADMVSSGNGHYYSYVTLPDTVGYYVAETQAIISGLPFKRRVRLRVINLEVD